jgi:hypothetical protein
MSDEIPEEWCLRKASEECGDVSVGAASALPACSISDTERMDWLVSKNVEVREPLLHGSTHIFHAQEITDEEDDYTATRLREQIDAMILAGK